MAGRGPKMADGVWKSVHPQVFGRSCQLSQNKFFDLSTPFMRKGRDGEWKMENGKKKNNGENSGPLTSLPVDRLTATDCNAAARAKIFSQCKNILNLMFLTSLDRSRQC